MCGMERETRPRIREFHIRIMGWHGKMHFCSHHNISLILTLCHHSLFMSAKLLQPPPQEERSTAYPRAIEKVISTAQKLQASIETMEIPISLCGRVSNVVVWEKSHWALIHKHIPVGTFLRLRNVHIPLKWESNNFRCELKKIPTLL